jgi:hypothetical protein
MRFRDLTPNLLKQRLDIFFAVERRGIGAPQTAGVLRPFQAAVAKIDQEVHFRKFH